MRSLLQDQTDIDILDQAELGLLGDRLEIGQIALLAFPNSRKHQQALEEGLWQLSKKALFHMRFVFRAKTICEITMKKMI